MKPWYVYMLLCNQEIFYVGITNDFKSRLLEHRNGKSIFTQKFSDLVPVYCERYEKKHQAVKREKQLKGWNKAKKQMLIDGKLGINTCTEFVDMV